MVRLMRQTVRPGRSVGAWAKKVRPRRQHRRRTVWRGRNHLPVELSLTTDQQIQLAIAGITALAALIALGNVVVTLVNERRRSQPIIVAHEAQRRYLASSGTTAAWAVDAYVSSEGGGVAFNVRFGVEFAGIRYPYKLREDDPDAGNLQRVLRAGERRPETGSWPILIPGLSMGGHAGQPDSGLDARRLYWARYENAQGQTWETRNPADRSARIHIRRVRRLRLREWRERRAREKGGERDREWERAVLAELQAGVAEQQDSGPTDSTDPPTQA